MNFNEKQINNEVGNNMNNLEGIVELNHDYRNLVRP